MSEFITRLEEDVDNIQKLGDNPRTDNGMDAAELKAWFDKAPVAIKQFLNSSLIPEIEEKFGSLDEWAEYVDNAISNFVEGTGFLMPDGSVPMTGNFNMSENRVINLGAPKNGTDAANKTYVDNTVNSLEREIGSEVEKAQTTASTAINQIPKARPYNYLDNSDFGSPVNKRGKEAYTAAGYSIDRWRQTNDIIAVRIADGHIQLEKNEQTSNTAKTVMFQQFIELPSHLKGKDVTLAARVIGGAVRLNINNNANQQSLYTYDYTKWQTVILNGTATSKNDEFYVAIQLSNNYGDINCNCAWIALYEGIYTEDNLPEYQPKGHMVEELNCGALTFRGDLTLSASKWSSSAPYSQSVSVVGITEDTDPHIYPVYSDTLATAKAQKEAFAMVSRGKTSDGAIQFICFEDKPTVDIPVRYEVNR
jgi:hypothetical protein